MLFWFNLLSAIFYCLYKTIKLHMLRMIANHMSASGESLLQCDHKNSGWFGGCSWFWCYWGSLDIPQNRIPESNSTSPLPIVFILHTMTLISQSRLDIVFILGIVEKIFAAFCNNLVAMAVLCRSWLSLLCPVPLKPCRIWILSVLNSSFLSSWSVTVHRWCFVIFM